MLRGKECVKEEYWKVLSTGEHLKVLLLVVGVSFILLFPISPPVSALQIPPAPVGDNPFVGVLYNARKNEMWE